MHRYGGVIEHVVGDRMLALFGVPHGHEDDAERAVRAAVSALDSLSEVWPEGTPPVVVRVAVEAGDVLVADDGAGRRTLTGALIGTAERLLTGAPPGRVVVGRGARAATPDTVECHELQTDQDVPAWEGPPSARLTAESGDHSHSEHASSAGTPSSPCFGMRSNCSVPKRGQGW